MERLPRSRASAMAVLQLALSFLTTIPFPRLGAVSDEKMSRTVAFFPFVGLVVGFFNVLCYLLGLSLFTTSVAAWLSLIANAVITGGLHLDGWMDTFDALGSRKPRSEMLAVMKDSRIGAMGALAVVLLLGLKFSLLTELHARPALILLAPAVGRSAILFATQTYSYVREQGLGKSFTQSLARTSWIFALATLVAPLLMLTGALGAVAATVALLLAMLWARLLARTFGGLTGDTYGALNELAEALFLLTAVGMLGVS